MASLTPFEGHTLAHVIIMCFYPLVGLISLCLVAGTDALSIRKVSPKFQTLLVTDIEKVSVLVSREENDEPAIRDITPLTQMEAKIKSHFEQYGAVCDVHIALELGQIEELLEEKELAEICCNGEKDEQALSNIRKRIMDTIFKNNSSIESMSAAFVLFEDASYVQDAIKFEKKYRIEKAMEPFDIFWTTLDTLIGRKVIWRIMMAVLNIIIMACILAIVIVFVAYEGYYGIADFSHYLRASSLLALTDERLRKNTSFLLDLIPIGLPILISILNEFLTIATELLTRGEKHKMKSTYMRSYAIKTMFYMILLSVIFPFLFDAIIARSNRDLFYINGGVRMLAFLVSQTFFSKGLSMIIEIVTTTIRFVLARIYGSRRILKTKVDLVSSCARNVMIATMLFSFGGLIPMIWIPGMLFYIFQLLPDLILPRVIRREVSRSASRRVVMFMGYAVSLSAIICPLITINLLSVFQPTSGTKLSATAYRAAVAVYSALVLFVSGLTLLMWNIIGNRYERSAKRLGLSGSDVKSKYYLNRATGSFCTLAAAKAFNPIMFSYPEDKTDYALSPISPMYPQSAPILQSE
ncbi:9 TM domain-containing transmembrane protein [Acrasis kona]|uniref:9 TM domain-containing transmembrane protein n=1 Tax=Acrasis kona TaxID=1008807 RepID=A0AAW2ZPW9_9EUKA